MDVKIIELLLFVMASLLVGVILKMVLRKTFVPYTVGLFIVGLTIGACSRYGFIELSPFVDHTLQGVSNLQPDIILYIFLPILIFEASLNLDTHIFKNTFANASLLAVPGVGVALLLTATLLMGIQFFLPDYNPLWNWNIAFLFGALISATDPVAVVALLHELKTDKRFSTLVDAESMLNDGTGIVFFMLFFGAFSLTTAHYNPVVNFILTVFGAIVIGLIVGLMSLWLTRRAKNDTIAQNSILFIAAYILFYVTNYVLEVSGVIALVTFGVVIAYAGRTRLSAQSSSFIRNFWALAAYLANTLIFIIVGIIIAMKCDFTWIDLLIIFVIYVGLNVIRALMVFLFLPIMRKLNYGLSVKEAIVLSWGGLRGALGLVLALLVFYTPTIPEEVRHQILLFTGGVVTLTLTINATTAGWLLEKLQLTRKPTAKLLLDYNIQSIYHEKMLTYFKELQERDSLKGSDWDALSLYLPAKSVKPHSENLSSFSFIIQIRRKVIERQLSHSTLLFQSGTISAYSERRLSGMLQELDDKDGSVSFMALQMQIDRIGGITSFQKRIMNKNSLIEKFFLTRIVNHCDLLHGFISMQSNALQLLKQISASSELDRDEVEAITIISEELEHNLSCAQKKLNAIAENCSVAFQQAVQQKAKRMLLRKERQIINELEHSGMLNEEESEEMRSVIGRKNRM